MPTVGQKLQRTDGGRMFLESSQQIPALEVEQLHEPASAAGENMLAVGRDGDGSYLEIVAGKLVDEFALVYVPNVRPPTTTHNGVPLIRAKREAEIVIRRIAPGFREFLDFPAGSCIPDADESIVSHGADLRI